MSAKEIVHTQAARKLMLARAQPALDALDSAGEQRFGAQIGAGRSRSATGD